MSQQLHPVMQLAIMPFAPRLFSRRPKPTESFSYSLCGVQLECELDFQAAERQTYHEPGSPADAQLCEALHNGEDIIELLSDEQKETIEIAFLEQDRSDDCDPSERDYDGFNADETSFG